MTSPPPSVVAVDSPVIDEFDCADWDEAVSREDAQPEQAIKLFKGMLDNDQSGPKLKEECILHLGRLYTRLGRADDFKRLFVEIRPFFAQIHKSRTAKIVRALIDAVGEGGNQLPLQADICEDAIRWCRSEKRTFLRQRIQTRLGAVYLNMKRFNEAIALLQGLIREVKKFDDKLLLVEIFLIESRCHLELSNLPKSKGALTAARSSANSIYCPPQLQAEIDLQAGILCSAEADYKTAYSYFYEAFEGYNTIKEPASAIKALKYMLVGKIMLDQYEDVYAIIQSKAGVRYASIEIQAMKAVTDAYKARSIHTFQAVYSKYHQQLAMDKIIASHLGELQEKLLEANLTRLIEPFSRVQISHVAQLIKLSRQQVEAKLSEMILDKKLNGILDQGAGDLILFNAPQTEKTTETTIETLKQLGGVVERLSNKAKKIHQ